MDFDPVPHLITLKGKQYLEVRWRLCWLREEHPDASIEVELTHLDLDSKLAVARATVTLPNGTKATEIGSETEKDFPAGWIEKSATKAVGRALAALGFGTQFALELDEGERFADSPVEPRAPQRPKAEQERPEKGGERSFAGGASGSATLPPPRDDGCAAARAPGGAAVVPQGAERPGGAPQAAAPSRPTDGGMAAQPSPRPGGAQASAPAQGFVEKVAATLAREPAAPDGTRLGEKARAFWAQIEAAQTYDEVNAQAGIAARIRAAYRAKEITAGESTTLFESINERNAQLRGSPGSSPAARAS